MGVEGLENTREAPEVWVSTVAWTEKSIFLVRISIAVEKHHNERKDRVYSSI